MIGIWQLVLIFAIVLVLFGAGRIPKVMKDLGSGLRAFKRGIEGETNEYEEIDVDDDLNNNRQVVKINKRSSKNVLENKRKTNKEILKKNGNKNTNKTIVKDNNVKNKKNSSQKKKNKK